MFVATLTLAPPRKRAGSAWPPQCRAVATPSGFLVGGTSSEFVRLWCEPGIKGCARSRLTTGDGILMKFPMVLVVIKTVISPAF
jgi:hypothetical protein